MRRAWWRDSLQLTREGSPSCTAMISRLGPVQETGMNVPAFGTCKHRHPNMPPPAWVLPSPLALSFPSEDSQKIEKGHWGWRLTHFPTDAAYISFSCLPIFLSPPPSTSLSPPIIYSRRCFHQNNSSLPAAHIGTSRLNADTGLSSASADI